MIILSAVLFSQCTFVWAQENSNDWTQEHAEWVAAEQRIKELTKAELSAEERCIAISEITWPLVKKGNLEARMDMLSSLAYFFLLLPGRSGDAISQMRDATILAVHTAGYNVLTSKRTDIVKDLHYLYENLPLGQLHGDDFLNCIENNWSTKCANYAVGMKKLVPPFEEFAAEVDLLLAQGMKFRCPEIWGDSFDIERFLKRKGD